MTFFQEVHDKYISIDFPERYNDILSVDKIVWYLADSINGLINVNTKDGKRIIEMDIKSAFPTICNCIFDKDSKFIKKLNSIEDKIKKNIFISTSLKDTEYLKQLNVISKMAITGSVFTLDPEAELLELKKDGIIFVTKLNNLENKSAFHNFLKGKGFIINIDEFKTYVRTNRTSTFMNQKNEMIRKGIFKYMPPYLYNVIETLLSGEFIDEDELLKIYSYKYWNIISSNKLDELMDKYYICDNGKILIYNGKYETFKNVLKYKDRVDPRMYLKYFVYPILFSTF